MFARRVLSSSFGLKWKVSEIEEVYNKQCTLHRVTITRLSVLLGFGGENRGKFRFGR